MNRRSSALAARQAGFLACCLLAAGCATRPCSLALAEVIPVRLAMGNGKIVVPATLDGVGVSLFLDTGSERTLLDRSAARRARSLDRMLRVVGIGGTQSGELNRQVLTIGRLHGNVITVSADFDPRAVARGYAGLLGMDVIGGYDIDLDLAGGEIRLYTDRGACPDAPVALPPPLASVAYLPVADDPRPHVPIWIDGHRLVALLDTGAPGLLLSSAAAATLHLSAATLAADPLVISSGAGPHRVAGRLHLIDQLTLGPLSIHHVPAVVLPQTFDPSVDVLLGMDFVRRIHFWLSNSSGRLVMQYPPLASPAPRR